MQSLNFCTGKTLIGTESSRIFTGSDRLPNSELVPACPWILFNIYMIKFVSIFPELIRKLTNPCVRPT